MARLTKLEVQGQWHSVSAMRTYERCPRQHWHAYIDRTDVGERLSPQHWRFGTCVHAALEGAARALSDHGIPWGSKASVAVAMDALVAAWIKERMPPYGGELERARGMVLETLADPQVNLTRANLLGVEHQLLDRTEGGWTFVGYVDRLERLSADTVRILDWKVTSSCMTTEELQTSPQLNLYAWAVRQEFDWADTVVIAHYYPPVNQLVSVTPDPEIVLDVMARFEAFTETAEADEFNLPRPTEHCAECLYGHLCPAMVREATVS